MDKVRLGIIGIGNMGSAHANWILGGGVNRCELTALCDENLGRLQKFPDVKHFTDSGALIRSGEVDAVLIATPHYQHTSIGIDAFENDLHVLVEKPIGVHKAACERLIAAAKAKPDKVFCAMFQQRTTPTYQKVRKLIRDGELGEIHRAVWHITTWFRSECYYASGGWRATWDGEGGGVLLNQCPHNLDLYQWILGMMPSKVRAFCKFGKYHDIEVEDDVTAYMEFPNGATGVFLTTTGEAPGSNRFEIHGERGKIVLEGGKPIQFTRNEQPITEFSRTTKSGFGTPETWDVTITPRGKSGGHNQITQNFVDAVLDGSELLAPAEEGIHSVELANAMLYSTWTDQTVELPLDGQAYEEHLNKLRRESTFTKKTSNKKADGEDFASSF